VTVAALIAWFGLPDRADDDIDDIDGIDGIDDTDGVGGLAAVSADDLDAELDELVANEVPAAVTPRGE
jgi:hypothetical protein